MKIYLDTHRRRVMNQNIPQHMRLQKTCGEDDNHVVSVLDYKLIIVWRGYRQLD